MAIYVSNFPIKIYIIQWFQTINFRLTGTCPWTGNRFFSPPKNLFGLRPKIKESNCIKNILPSCCICIYLVLLCTTQQFWWIIECWPFDFPLAEICAALIRLCSTVLEKQIASDWIYSLSLIFLSLEQAFFLHAQLETMFRTAFLNIILGKKAKLNSFKRRKKN